MSELARSAKLRNTAMAPVTILAYFTAVIAVFLPLTGNRIEAAFFAYIAVVVAGMMVLHVFFRPRGRRRARIVSLFLVGGVLFLGAGLFGRMDFQIEGFFFFAFAGLAIGTVVHYLIAKIIGPLVIGRGWCGWGCWTAAVLDLLPYRKSPGRLPGGWDWLRYLHFAVSAVVVAMLFFGFRYTVYRRDWDPRGMVWFLAGNAVYFGLAIPLAYTLKDNRAFCKYACPIVTFMKPAAIPSLLKIRGDAAACDDCGACAKVCPMDIQVNEFAREGCRVLTSGCILCLTCVDSCPRGALAASVGFDLCRPRSLRRIG